MESLRRWFLLRRRSLPWREDPTPYRVWVSEVMLQQTQVSVVVPYFERWMERFPTVRALAESSVEEVVKLWEGLGYYSRARNLHAGARMLMERHGGELPEDEGALSAIKGLGPYTVGAIQSFAFRRRAAAVDGNVLRVVTRYLGMEDDIARSGTVRRVREEVESFLPEERPWEVMEGLIELGAKVCRRSPSCGECPLRGSCVARATGRAEELPVNSRKSLVTRLQRFVPVIRSEGCYLVRQVPEREVMGGLYEFPYVEVGGEVGEDEVLSLVSGHFGLECRAVIALPEVVHTFTRYRAQLFPWLLDGPKRGVEGYTWLELERMHGLPFSAGHRRLLEDLECRGYCSAEEGLVSMESSALS